MSTAIVLPTLTQWTENHITAIINATNQQDLTNAIDAFLSKNATIVVNGVEISRAEFKKQLQLEKFDEAGAAISFVGAIQVPADKDKPFDVSSDNDVCTSTKINSFYLFARPDLWDSFITPSLARQSESATFLWPAKSQFLSMWCKFEVIESFILNRLIALDIIWI